MTKKNCAEIAVWLRGRSLREVETFAQRLQPAGTVKDRVREIFIRSAKPDARPRSDTALTDGSPALSGSPREDIPAGEINKNYSNSTPSAGSKTAQRIDNNIVKNRGARSGAGDDSGGGAIGPVCVSPAERVVTERKLQFAVDPEFMEKLARVRSLLSTKYPGNSGAVIMT